MLKEKLKQEDKIHIILEALDCHKIKSIGDEYRAALPDGDNATALRINPESLAVRCYTRSDFPEVADIITLVEYIKKIHFTKAMYWICETCGFDYYVNYQKEQAVDPCVRFLDEVEPRHNKYEEQYLRKLDERVLDEYVPYPNYWFLHEGITYDMQRIFELGFSVKDERITIPIRDELGNLVGVKARTVLDHKELNIPKYLYLYQMPKSLILYGLDKSYPYIEQQKEVLVWESEKSVLKCWSNGIYNCVSIGGHELSQTQAMKLERLGVKVILAFDNDIKPEQLQKEKQKFLIHDNIYAIIAHKNKALLGEKESPIDAGFDTFQILYEKDLYKVP